MEENNRINLTIKTAIENVSNLIDVNTVVGSPLKMDDGELIIPISKVSFGILSAGGEYGKVGVFKSSNDLPYSAGNGTIVSIKPCAFLVKDVNSGYKILTVEKDSVEKLAEKAVEFISDLKDKF